MGSGISCNTCIYEIATVVELANDSINFNYSAFPFIETDDNSLGSQNQSCFTLNARWEHIEKFEFNPKTQTLSFIYLTDDNTPVQSNKQEKIIQRLVFDGDKFKD